MGRRTSKAGLEYWRHQIEQYETSDQTREAYYAAHGFWLYYRRLEKWRFQWPEQTCKTMSISRRQLNWLLDGLSIEQSSSHRSIKASVAV